MINMARTMIIQTSKNTEIKPIKLGKKIELRNIPYSELAIPWNICIDTTTSGKQNQHTRSSIPYNFIESNSKNAKASKIFKSSELKHLKYSIPKYGLLKPFEVAEMYEKLGFFYGKGKYLIIDGQRRYFALRELLKLPTEGNEEKIKDKLWSDNNNEIVAKGEIQDQEFFSNIDIRDHILIPCIVYPYKTFLQMARHSLEGKRFSEKPAKQDYEVINKMTSQKISDLKPDDLRELFRVRRKIEEERASIKTLKN